MTKAPATGAATTQIPRCWSCNGGSTEEKRWKKTRFVSSAMSQRRALATRALTTPIGTASVIRTSIRESVRKSRRTESCFVRLGVVTASVLIGLSRSGLTAQSREARALALPGDQALATFHKQQMTISTISILPCRNHPSAHIIGKINTGISLFFSRCERTIIFKAS